MIKKLGENVWSVYMASQLNDDEIDELVKVMKNAEIVLISVYGSNYIVSVKEKKEKEEKVKKGKENWENVKLSTLEEKGIGSEVDEFEDVEF